MSEWASDFYEIQAALGQNDYLLERTVELAEREPIHGKSTEGEGRTDSLRGILVSYFQGDLNLDQAIAQVSVDLPQRESPHSHNNRVFPQGWEERLVRTQASRFYNQAALQLLSEEGHTTCVIPHSPNEDRDSPCTQRLAGGESEVAVLLDRLERAYGQGEWHDEVKIPNHPHCTHTVVPQDEAE